MHASIQNLGLWYTQCLQFSVYIMKDLKWKFILLRHADSSTCVLKGDWFCIINVTNIFKVLEMCNSSDWNIYFALVILLFSFAVNIQSLPYLKAKRLLVFITEISLIHLGACCPLCAGMLRILYDKDKLDNFARVNSSIMPNIKWYM